MTSALQQIGRWIFRFVALLFLAFGVYAFFVVAMLSQPWPPDGETLHLAIPIFSVLGLLALGIGALLARVGWKG